MIYTTINANMHETLFYLVGCEKFLLALIFCITQLCLNMVTKVGVLQVSPLKKNLVPSDMDMPFGYPRISIPGPAHNGSGQVQGLEDWLGDEEGRF
jgi:hypothetical protein